MNALSAAILGIIQGLTEFLPISSSGHLMLFKKLLGVETDNMLFDVAVHLGTLVPIFLIYWRDIWELIKKPFQKTTYLLIMATVPAVVAALFFEDAVDMLFQSGPFLALGFIITGIALLLADKIGEKGYKKDKAITFADALIIGIVQAVAITPGISRSGSTITGGLFRGLTRQTAAKFSFLMSIPVILGAAVLQIKSIVSGGVTILPSDILPIVIGFITAMLSGYLAISFMINIISRGKLKYFSFYVFGLAILWLILITF